jgi:hypothetical protein
MAAQSDRWTIRLSSANLRLVLPVVHAPKGLTYGGDPHSGTERKLMEASSKVLAGVRFGKRCAARDTKVDPRKIPSRKLSMIPQKGQALPFSPMHRSPRALP